MIAFLTVVKEAPLVNWHIETDKRVASSLECRLAGFIDKRDHEQGYTPYQQTKAEHFQRMQKVANHLG